jgi:hypothetical protein
MHSKVMSKLFYTGMAFKDGTGDNAAQAMLRWRLHDKCGAAVPIVPHKYDALLAHLQWQA